MPTLWIWQQYSFTKTSCIDINIEAEHEKYDMILVRNNFIWINDICEGKVGITFSDSNNINILAYCRQVWPRIMEHSQRSAALKIFVEAWFFSPHFLIMWEVSERSWGTFWRKSESQGAHFGLHCERNCIWIIIFLLGPVSGLADKWRLPIDPSFLDALKGKIFCCILLFDRCACGLGPRRQWNSVSESWEIRGSAGQWDSN